MGQKLSQISMEVLHLLGLGGRGSVYGGALKEGCIPSVGVFSARGIMSWLTFSRMELTDEQLNDERMWT